MNTVVYDVTVLFITIMSNIIIVKIHAIQARHTSSLE